MNDTDLNALKLKLQNLKSQHQQLASERDKFQSYFNRVINALENSVQIEESDRGSHMVVINMHECHYPSVEELIELSQKLRQCHRDLLQTENEWKRNTGSV